MSEELFWILVISIIPMYLMYTRFLSLCRNILLPMAEELDRLREEVNELKKGGKANGGQL